MTCITTPADMVALGSPGNGDGTPRAVRSPSKSRRGRASRKWAASSVVSRKLTLRS